VPVACFGAIALGQQEDMWLRPNLPLRANFTYPQNVVRNQEAAQMNNIRIDPKEFQKSITKELDTIKNRVRNLIGSSHWGEEGRYKEAILRNVIKRFLPSNLSI